MANDTIIVVGVTRDDLTNIPSRAILVEGNN